MTDLLVKSVLLGIGLAMDAFSVSVASGLSHPDAGRERMIRICAVFGIFQFLMPMIGWFCVHTIVDVFSAFQKFVPWIALALLLFIGGKMLYEGISKKNDGEEMAELRGRRLFVLGIATSIDALSVGFTISEYDAVRALGSSLIIGVVTFVICMLGIFAGRKVGKKLSSAAPIVGGSVLIAIGIEIFVKGVLL